MGDVGGKGGGSGGCRKIQGEEEAEAVGDGDLVISRQV